MAYQSVCLASLGYTLPREIVSSDEIESRLDEVYQRLRLPPGRLELMSGIRERRFWARGTLPSQVSIQSARRALVAAAMEPGQIGALVHASVCRDFLEPATASVVHAGLGLSPRCLVFDLSNACLGFLNSLLVTGNMIELGQIEAALVVASEGGRELVENTIATLNHDRSMTRSAIKHSVASLTIGSASVAAVVAKRDDTRPLTRLLTGVAAAETEHVGLCQSERDDAAAHGMQPLMRTDSERLLEAGVAAAERAFDRFLGETGWQTSAINRTFCHQVGSAHRRALLERLGLMPERDFTTFQWLGNTGAAALPITLARGAEAGLLKRGDQVALLGIGSGINVAMLALEWEETRVAGGEEA